MKFFSSYIVFVAVSVLLFSSCNNNLYKNIPYFADLSDSARLNIARKEYRALKIEPDDILIISIQTIDPLSASVNSLAAPVPSALYPTSSTLSGVLNSAAPNLEATGTNLLVDKNGFIELPTLGKINVVGLTTDELRDTIHARAEIYFKQPTVNVRFGNFKVSILGEVQRPGTYVIPNERATIFDALGLAGDLTVFGKRENMVLIRDSAGVSKLVRLNLNSKDIIASDYFYLKQNDVLYVEPNKAKLANLDAVKTRNFTIASAVLSVLIILATRIN